VAENLHRPSLTAALTEREREILRLLANGLSDAEIAHTLVLTVGTIKWYNRQIYSKLGVHSRSLAIAHAQSLGLLTETVREAPPSVTPSIPRHNLPAQLTTFIGRENELAEIKRLLGISRLLTLTGPPGTGKTRLALQCAAGFSGIFQHGVFLVSLASIRDPGLIVNSIARTLDVPEAGSKPILHTLKDFLHDRRLLLVLDNFEHLLPGAPVVSELLSASPQLTILVTSREVLKLYGEYEFPVPPLQIPNLRAQHTVAGLLAYEAVALFVQRASAISTSFALTDENATSVASICVHLDGLPLAIELAAARSKIYAPQTMLVRLGSRLDALSDGPRDLPVRQKTLRATLAWSYDLLDAEEKILFARLGIFAGGCTVEAAQAICSTGLTLDCAAGLESLLNKSLLSQETGLDGEQRFVMLETMREYALERLNEEREIEFVGRRHALYYLALAERAAPELYGANQSRELLRLETEHDNLRAALQWSLETDETAETSFRFIGSLARFWEVKAHFSEGRAWLPAALSLGNQELRSKARADAVRGIGDIAYLQCDYRATQALYEEALLIYRSLGNRSSIAHTLLGLGEVATEVGDYQSAMAIFQEAHTIMNELGDTYGLARSRAQLGFGALRMGDIEGARIWLEEALSGYEQVDETVGSSLVYSGLGEIALRQGQLDHATELLEKSLNLREALGQKWGVAASLGSLAWVALKRGNLEYATETLSESLKIRQEIGDVGGCAWCLEKFGEIALVNHDLTRAAMNYGAAASLRASVDSVIDPADVSQYEGNLSTIRAELGHEVFSALWAEAQLLSIQQVALYALQIRKL
jgi:predicted ATPase/DNA-binding CsgD family transcriptional regulator